MQQLIVLSGRDVLPENILSAVCHIASAVVYVLPTTPSSCKVVLKKPSGKVLKSVSSLFDYVYAYTMYMLNIYKCVLGDKK